MKEDSTRFIVIVLIIIAAVTITTKSCKTNNIIEETKTTLQDSTAAINAYSNDAQVLISEIEAFAEKNFDEDDDRRYELYIIAEELDDIFYSMNDTVANDLYWQAEELEEIDS